MSFFKFLEEFGKTPFVQGICGFSFHGSPGRCPCLGDTMGAGVSLMSGTELEAALVLFWQGESAQPRVPWGQCELWEMKHCLKEGNPSHH